MIVLKFGGTSVGSVESAMKVVDIVRSRLDRKPVVVVSALSGVTDLLYRIASSREELPENIKALKDRHFQFVRKLIPDDRHLCMETQKKLQAIIDKVQETASMPDSGDREKAAVISSGEIMSSTIMCAALCNAGIRTQWADARKFITASGDPLKSEPDIDEIRERAPEVIAQAFSPAADGTVPQAVITQGFICASHNGKPALLGRGGSDYSASLIAMAVDASAVEIWTDVDGVRTADPRRVPTTRCLRRISYEEAAEMAHFGAKVLHPLTLEPVQARNIPVYVLNTHNPEGECTEILSRDNVREPVRSVSYKDNVLLIKMTSRVPLGNSGFIKKTFDVLGESRISVDLVSTGNSSISITVDAGQGNIGRALEKIGIFAQVDVTKDMAQISAIGSSASDISSILRMDFAPLRNSRIYMISPGASFVNVSFVVDRSQLDAILCETHKELVENEGSN